MGDSLPAKGDNLGFVQAYALAATDPDAQLFAIAAVGKAESLDLGHRRVGEEKFLDFTRVDVLAPANDHVLQPTNNVAVTFCIDCRQISGMHESGVVDRSCRRRAIIPIAGLDAIATGEQLPGNAGRDDAT